MKFLLAHIIAVALIISSSLLVTAHLGQNARNGKLSTNDEKNTFTVLTPKEMKRDSEQVVPKRRTRDAKEEQVMEMHGTTKEEVQEEQNNFDVPYSLPARNHGSAKERTKKEAKRQVSGQANRSLESCSDALSSGYHIIRTPQEVKNVSCREECGNITGGWMRVAYIDVNETRNCTPWLEYIEVDSCPPNDDACYEMLVPVCKRPYGVAEENGCYSLKFPTHGVNYTKVCGMAQGYQYGFTRAFHSSKYAGQDLNSAYVSGLSVTHGAPGNRDHIWTFAAGYSNAYGYIAVNCPSAQYPGPEPPEFVCGNYSCDSGNPDNLRRGWYLVDMLTKPLWSSDGSGPWFTTSVTQIENDTDYIEVRMCHYPPYTYIEDIGVSKLEIYIS